MPFLWSQAAIIPRAEPSSLQKGLCCQISLEGVTSPGFQASSGLYTESFAGFSEAWIHLLFSPVKHLRWASSACCLLLKKRKRPLRCIHLKTFFFHKQTLSELFSLLLPPPNLCSFREGKPSTSKIKIFISVSYLTELYMTNKEGEVQNKPTR